MTKNWVMKFHLRLIFVLFFLTIFSFDVSAQQKSSPAIDFTLTDTEGNEKNLFETLADGKTVILYFFSCNCIHCYLNAPILDSIYRQFGSGSESLEVWGICDQNYNNENIQFFIDSTHVTFPCFATGHAADVFSLYEIQYTPQIKIICDYMVSESIAFNQIVESLSHCFPTETKISKIESPLIIFTENFISIETTKQISQAGVYDIMGRKIQANDIDKSHHISIHNLTYGNLYILNIIFVDGTSHSEKIILR